MFRKWIYLSHLNPANTPTRSFPQVLIQLIPQVYFHFIFQPSNQQAYYLLHQLRVRK